VVVVVVGAVAVGDDGVVRPGAVVPVTRPVATPACRDGVSLPPVLVRKKAARASEGAASPPATMRKSRMNRDGDRAGAGAAVSVVSSCLAITHLPS
jgi:hypothetical protein